MTSEHEPDWMRDKRLKDEEARMVQLENNVGAIRTQVDAIKELFDEERKLRRAAEAALLAHEEDDSSKFSSIDSRLQGAQTQLSTVVATLERIEKKVDSHEPRLKDLEDTETGRSATGRFIRNSWTQVGIGAGIGGTLVGLYSLLVS